MDIAIAEIKAVQSMNQTSKADPNYHLVISFAEGEKPDIDVLKDIEKEFADALGFSDHQRIIGTHINTDNFHMHIMFNKVHPETFKMHTPYRDYKTVQETCMVLEKRYGLRPGKGREEKRDRINSKAQDMEGFTWEKSFSTFLKERKDLLIQMRDSSSSWADFHEKLDALGVSIKAPRFGKLLPFRKPIFPSSLAAKPQKSRNAQSDHEKDGHGKLERNRHMKKNTDSFGSTVPTSEFYQLAESYRDMIIEAHQFLKQNVKPSTASISFAQQLSNRAEMISSQVDRLSKDLKRGRNQDAS